MLWAIFRTNKPGTDHAREELRPVHREYLQSQKKILVLAGPLQNDEGTESTGSLLIVNVNSRAEAQAFIDGDPLTKAGFFSNITITRMRKGQWNPQAGEGA